MLIRISETIKSFPEPRFGIFKKEVSLSLLDLFSSCILISLPKDFCSWITSSEFISISPILSPSEILSPILILIVLILPENWEGTSTLDLSLSKVMIPSFP